MDTPRLDALEYSLCAIERMTPEEEARIDAAFETIGKMPGWTVDMVVRAVRQAEKEEAERERRRNGENVIRLSFVPPRR
ncbi:MAG TPA: hypothetical protein VK943_10290 [Arenibaculum sp.]|nr:hypothetical protein [Arenibaculum sp.]